MSKEKKKKPFYKRWWVWLVAIIIVIAIASGGGEDEERKGVETASDEKEKSEDEEKTEFDIDEKVELDNRVIQVTDVEKSDGDDFDKPKEGNEFVIVHVSIENNGDKEVSYNPLDFKMKNSNGQIEDTTFTTIDSDSSLSSGDLAPGGNVSGTLAFEQPIDDEELQLIFEASFWSDKEIIFNLQ